MKKIRLSVIAAVAAVMLGGGALAANAVEQSSEDAPAPVSTTQVQQEGDKDVALDDGKDATDEKQDSGESQDPAKTAGTQLAVEPGATQDQQQGAGQQPAFDDTALAGTVVSAETTGDTAATTGTQPVTAAADPTPCSVTIEWGDVDQTSSMLDLRIVAVGDTILGASVTVNTLSGSEVPGASWLWDGTTDGRSATLSVDTSVSASPFWAKWQCWGPGYGSSNQVLVTVPDPDPVDPCEADPSAPGCTEPPPIDPGDCTPVQRYSWNPKGKVAEGQTPDVTGSTPLTQPGEWKANTSNYNGSDPLNVAFQRGTGQNGAWFFWVAECSDPDPEPTPDPTEPGSTDADPTPSPTLTIAPGIQPGGVDTIGQPPAVQVLAAGPSALADTGSQSLGVGLVVTAILLGGGVGIVALARRYHRATR